MKNVTVSTAIELSKKEVDEIVQKLEKKLGEKLSVTTKVNAKLLGGISITIGSQHFDGTLAHKLETIHQHLNEQI